MESSSSAASTLRPPRIAVGIISAIATATIAYSFYQTFYGATEFDHVGLRRSNATRRPRRTLRRTRTHRTASPSPSPSEVDEDAAEDNTVRPTTEGETLADTVADDATNLGDDWWNDPASQPRAGQNIVNLLFRVSEDNARRNAYVHRGCACNACGLIPIRGIRYRCANCADFDLCETCESQGLHTKTHIFYKVRVPAPPFGPRQSQPVWYPGDPNQTHKMLKKSVMPQLSRETGFERPELEAFWEQWTFLANTEWREDPLGLELAMDRKTFERCLVPSGGYRHTAPNLIHDRMFAFYDTNNDDLIGFQEFLHGLAYRKRKDKLRKIFDGYDIDGDGLVSRKDFLRIFRAYYVLYKQMHQDIIEGIDDQVLSSAEVNQLVNGRQPLSSFFGRDGRFPPALDANRPLEGKVRAGSDVFVESHVNGVVADDKPDQVDRSTVLTKLFDEYDPRYFRAILRPPTRVDQLPDLLTNSQEVDQEHPHGDGDADWAGWAPADEEEELFVDENRGPIEEQGNGSFFTLEQILQDEPQTSRSPELRQQNVAAPGETPDDETMGQITSRPPSYFQHGDAEHITAPLAALVAEQTHHGSSHVTDAAVVAPISAASRRGDFAFAARAARVPSGLPPTDPVPSGRPLGRAGSSWQNGERTERQTSLAERGRMVAESKRSQAEARKKLFDRWRRRQFYLDEEEGAVKPADWDEGQDILAHMLDGGDNGESSKAAEQPHMLSPRSRSNSKVRFAEDTDDFETRSNPSTSSRSIPERWGGMEIPDAERDAGKEILYQVTQQSFNELLDTFFKQKEDLAIEAAETKELRAKYRSQYQDIDYWWEVDQAQGEANKSTEEPGSGDLAVYRKKGLSELLAISGYAVDVTIDEDETEEEPSEERQDMSGEGANKSDEARGELQDLEGRVAEEISRRDPTMPQFRPNSTLDIFLTDSSSSGRLTTPTSPTPTEQADTSTTSAPSKGKGKENYTPEESQQNLSKEEPPTRETLIKWKGLDIAEEEAKERGGWGRLDYEEFEEIYHNAAKEGNKLDYMGSWIDFCIP